MLSETGYPYEEIEQKNSWNNVISSTIPATWGLFDDPRTKTETRAVESTALIQHSIGQC